MADRRGFGTRTVLAPVTAGCLLLALSSCSPASGERVIASPSIAVAGPAVAGRTVDVSYRFAVAPGAPPVEDEDDYLVFVHAFDASGRRVWTADHEPPIAVRLWTPGSIVEYARPMSVPRNAPPGRTSIELGLYSPRSGERLPLSGADRGRRSYVVSSLDVAAPEEPPAIFVEGWHDLEAPSPDVQWHWSTGVGTIWLRNPGADSVFVLDLDQPMLASSASRRIGVLLGGAEVGAFTVPPGQRRVERIPVTASQLGANPLVTVVVTVDRTFVPADVPDSGSGDTRELGVRVFAAYLEPR